MSKRRIVVIIALICIGTAAAAIVSGTRQIPPPSSTMTAYDRTVDAEAPVSSLWTMASPAVVATAWTVNIGATAVAPMLVVGDLIYMVVGETTDASRLLAVDRESGDLVWQRGLKHVADQSPVVAGDLLFVVTRSRELLALQRRSGELVWSFQAGTLISGRPLVEDGVLYLGADAIYALDAASGAQRWQRDLGGRILHPLALSAGVIAAVGGDHTITLLDADNGRQRLSFPLWFNPLGAPLIRDGIVAVAGNSGHVQALDLHAKDRFGDKSLRFFWTRLWLYGSAPRPPLPQGYAWQARNNAIGGHLLGADGGHFYLALDYAGGTSDLVSLGAGKGTERWRLPISARPTESVLLHSDVLLVTTQAGEMIGVDAATGGVKWLLSLPGGVASTPALDGDRLFVSTVDGTLHALALGRGG